VSKNYLHTRTLVIGV